MPVTPPISTLLLNARTAAGLSQAAVAARMGTTQSAIARAEAKGGPDPTIGFLERYATAVGQTLAPVIEPPAPQPPPTRAEVHRQAPKLRHLARRLGFRSVRLVGSVARGDARPDSDVDLLVSPGTGLRGATYFAAMDSMQAGAQRILRRSVDIIDMSSVSSSAMRNRLLQEARTL